MLSSVQIKTFRSYTKPPSVEYTHVKSVVTIMAISNMKYVPLKYESKTSD